MMLYGIANCDTCRKARKEIEAAGLSVTFRDVRAEPLESADISRFLAAFGDRLVNRASTTWRALGPEERERDPADLLAAHPALMKRPVLERDGVLALGWTPESKALILK